jgi:hypothetical protein
MEKYGCKISPDTNIKTHFVSQGFYFLRIEFIQMFFDECI